jgi:hypothetical protein
MEWETIDQYTWRKEISSYYRPRADIEKPLWRLYIKGPAGNVYADDIVSFYPRLDQCEMFYWSMIAVRDGHYHCCLSGKTFIF